MSRALPTRWAPLGRRAAARAAAGALARRLSTLPQSPQPSTLDVLTDFHDRHSRRRGKAPRVCDSAEEAIGPLLKSGCMVFVQGGAATPQVLIDGMIKAVKRRGLEGVRTIHMHLEGEGPLPPGDGEAAKRISPIGVFVGPNLRRPIQEGTAEYMPIHLGELPLLLRRRLVRPDLALLHVSTPDRHGNCTLGVSVDWTRSAAEHSRALVGLVNPQMPRVFGDGAIHISQLDAVVHHDAPIFQHRQEPLSREELQIGQNIASLVPNGATLQMGIGRVPDAALGALGGHRNLGVHSEMFSDGLLPLIESGAVDNSQKTSSRGVTTSSFVVGSERLYDWMHDNPTVQLMDVSYTNRISVIAAQNKMVGINSCIEMDLEGQAASSAVGQKIYSGFGGQVDFLRGAAECPGGKAILAFTSRTKKGVPRIVEQLTPGAEVVTTSAVVQYAVTEYGVAYLFGKTLPARARELIRLAHPEDREELERAAHKRFGRAFLR